VSIGPSPSIEPARPTARPIGFGTARRRERAEARPVPWTLAGSALWLVSSSLFYAACQWATIAALAKLGALVAIGHLGLALAVATPIIVLTSLGLRTVQATDMVATASVAVVNEVFYFALIASRRMPVQLALECVALLVTVAGGLVMIPRFGVGGAAGATVVATVTRTALAGVLVLRWRR